MNYLSLVLRNLTRNKRRTILTMLSITVSVFIFAALISLPGLINQVLRDRANSLRLICHSKAGFSTCCRKLIAAESKPCHTSKRSPPTASSSQLTRIRRSNWASSPLTTITSPRSFPIGRSPRKPIANSAAPHRRAGRKHPDEGYGWKVGQTIMLHGTMYPVDMQLTIVGVLTEAAPVPA